MKRLASLLESGWDPNSPILGTHRLTIVNPALEKHFSRQMVVFTQDRILDMH